MAVIGFAWAGDSHDRMDWPGGGRTERWLADRPERQKAAECKKQPVGVPAWQAVGRLASDRQMAPCLGTQTFKPI